MTSKYLVFSVGEKVSGFISYIRVPLSGIF